MIKRTVTFRRADTSINFYQNDAEWEKYKKEKYHDTGMIISEEKEISKDGLSMTVSWVYKNLDSLETFLDDPKNIENFKKRHRYNLDNNIKKITEDSIV
jgi:hypothetical protein